jgi:hypothetical protein
MFLWGVQDDVSHHRRRYTLSELKQKLRQAGMNVERASYANISFFGPILLGRLFMRASGLRPRLRTTSTSVRSTDCSEKYWVLKAGG